MTLCTGQVFRNMPALGLFYVFRGIIRQNLFQNSYFAVPVTDP